MKGLRDRARGHAIKRTKCFIAWHVLVSVAIGDRDRDRDRAKGHGHGHGVHPDRK